MDGAACVLAGLSALERARPIVDEYTAAAIARRPDRGGATNQGLRPRGGAALRRRVGYGRLGSTSNGEREALLTAQTELNRKQSAFSMTFNERLDEA